MTISVPTPVANPVVTSVNHSAMQEQIIQSKLQIYDVVASKNPVEIRKMMNDFMGYALDEENRALVIEKDAAKQKYISEEIEIIHYKEIFFKTMSDADLVDMTYSSYQSQYGSRENFQKDLENPKTIFTEETSTHVGITLPQVTSGMNIDIRVLDAYLVDGAWR